MVKMMHHDPSIYEYDDDAFEEDVSISSINQSFRPRLDSRMSLCLPSKGLFNSPGDNNCFLNASVQILWHLNVFRRSFRLLRGHACLGNACIFCALKRIFKEFEGSDARVLDPDDLRQSLANAFVDDQRFQLGRMDDAAECFENILHRLHSHLANKEFEDACSAKHCIPHQKFALHILEQTSCQCQATGEPKSFYQFVSYVSASMLVEQAQMFIENDEPYTFGQLIKSANSGESRPCPDEKRCYYKNSPSAMTSVQTTLINSPDVVTVGIIWNTETPNSKYIGNVLQCVGDGQSLFLIDLFDNIPDDNYRRLELHLVGVVAYYGRHYVSFFYNTKEEEWIYFDDAHVRKLGPHWDSVVTKCRRNRFQPLLIIYSNSDGRSIDISSAPRDIEVVSKEALLAQPPKSPTHRKHKGHRHRRKKGRSRSNSPATTPTSQSSDRSSVSPRSPRKHQTMSSPKPPKRTRSPLANENFSATQAEHFAYKQDENVEPVLLSGTSMRSSVPPENTFVDRNTVVMGGGSRTNDIIHTSVSDNSIYNSSVSNNGAPSYSDNPTERKRGGSLKKRFGNVMKNIKPISQKPKKQNKPSKPGADVMSHSSSMDQISYADAGFRPPHLKLNDRNSAYTKPPPPSGGGKQMASLQKHHDLLDKTFDLCKETIDVDRQRGEDRNVVYYENDDRHTINIHDDEDGCIVGEKYGQPYDVDDGLNSIHDDDSTQIHRRSEVETTNGPPSYDLYEKSQEDFQKLVNDGDYLLQKSEQCERAGDIPLALQHCVNATGLFRDASKLNGISESLIQYVDYRRNFSFDRSVTLRKKLNPILDCDIHSTLTSDYIDATSQVSKAVSPLDKHDLVDLVNIQNHNALLQAKARLSLKSDVSKSTNQINPKELREMESVLESLDFQQSDTGHSANFPRTVGRLASDKPNPQFTHQHKNHLKEKVIEPETIDHQSSSRTKNVRQPDIPNGFFYGAASYSDKGFYHGIQFVERTTLPTNDVEKTSGVGRQTSTKDDLYAALASRNVTSKKTGNGRVKSIYDNLTTDNEKQKQDFDVRETIYDNILPNESRTTLLISDINNRDALRTAEEESRLKSASYTLEKLRKDKKKNLRCKQCGWRKVESPGTFCESCQSEYL